MVCCVAAVLCDQADAAAWGGIDTLHILAGVPSTRTLLQLAGVDLVADPQDKSPKPRLIPQAIGDSSLAPSSLPTKEGLENLLKELRALNEINIVGTVLSLATFVSRCPISQCSDNLSAPPPRLVVQVTGSPPPLVGQRCHPRPHALPVLSHQGRRVHGL